MLWLAKLAVLLQLLHIFVPSRRSSAFMFWMCHGLIWTILAFYTSALLFDIFRCTPINNAWEAPEKNCIQGELAWTVSAAFNTVSDIIILFLPMRAIWCLRLESRRKVGVAAIFATGIM